MRCPPGPVAGAMRPTLWGPLACWSLAPDVGAPCWRPSPLALRATFAAATPRFGGEFTCMVNQRNHSRPVARLRVVEAMQRLARLCPRVLLHDASPAALMALSLAAFREMGSLAWALFWAPECGACAWGRLLAWLTATACRCWWLGPLQTTWPWALDGQMRRFRSSRAQAGGAAAKRARGESASAAHGR